METLFITQENTNIGEVQASRIHTLSPPFLHMDTCCPVSSLPPETLQERVGFICGWWCPTQLVSWSWTLSNTVATQGPRVTSAPSADSLCRTSPSFIFRSLKDGANLPILYFNLQWTLSSTSLAQDQKLCLRQLSQGFVDTWAVCMKHPGIIFAVTYDRGGVERRG